MKKTNVSYCLYWQWRKLLLIMKLVWIFILAGMFVANAKTFSQDVRLDLKTENASLKSVLSQIEEKTDYYFFYKNEEIENLTSITVDAKQELLSELLNDILENKGFEYEVHDHYILIQKANENSSFTDLMQQQKSISGKVTDLTGASLPGVSVVVKGTTTGVITDIDGKYTLTKVPENATLQFSFVGMKTIEIKLDGRSVLNVKLQETSIGIDEVVTIAYGTQKKRELTGAISSIKTDGTTDMPVAQFSQGIQGKVSGVQIFQTSGTPGGGMSFRIRGAASLNSGNSPLFVIDGMPVTGEISNISSEEIESYSVLKDASASALYGSRAANGVILITTKKAKENKTAIEFSANAGIQAIPMDRMPDLMNATEYAQYKKNYYEDMIKYTGWTNSAGKAEVPDEYKNPSSYGEGTNWFDLISREAPIQNYSLSLFSGNDKLKTSVITSYTQQEGVLLNTDYQRLNFRINTEYKLSESIKIGANLAPSYRIHNNQATDGGWAIIASALYAPPTISPYNADGSYRKIIQAYGGLQQPNPYLMITERVNKYKGTRIIGNAFAELEFLKGLKWKSTINLDVESTNQRVYVPQEAAGEINSIGTKSYGSYQTGFGGSWSTEHTLNYNTKIGNHSIDLLGGFSAQKFRWEGSGIYGENYTNDYPWLNQATTTKLSGSNTPTAWSLASFLARASYSFKEKYLFQAAIRRDGCSKFGADNRWGYFPSVSAGWIASEESFMKSISHVMNYLKIRASYGTTGNNDIGNYTYYSSIGNSNYAFNGTTTSGAYLSGLENRQLGWEKTKQLDFGADLGFFKDRIYFQVDYWEKRTSDMLYSLTLPYSSGYGSVQTNIGEAKFHGFDFDLETKNMVGEFKWSTNLNLSLSRNKVLSLGPNTDHLGGDDDYGGDWNRTEVGKPMGFLYGYIYDGVFMNASELEKGPIYADSDANRASIVGSPRMKDITNDGKITRADRTMIGNPNPDFLFGITNTFTYKRFDLSVVISGAIGGDLVMRSMEYSYNLDGAFNMDKALLNCWRSEDNPGDGRISRAAGPGGTTWLSRDRSSLMVYDGSYAACKNITFGYKLPEISLVKNARAYASIQNLFMVTKYPGPNPESSKNGMNARYGGIDDNSYPVPRVFSIGINMSL